MQQGCRQGCDGEVYELCCHTRPQLTVTGGEGGGGGGMAGWAPPPDPLTLENFSSGKKRNCPKLEVDFKNADFFGGPLTHPPTPLPRSHGLFRTRATHQWTCLRTGGMLANQRPYVS